MYTITMLPAAPNGRARMSWVEPTGVMAGAKGSTVPTAAPTAAFAHMTCTALVQQATPFIDQVVAAATNGVNPGLRHRRRPPA